MFASLAISISVALPIIVFPVKLIFQKWTKLTIAEKGFLLSCLVLAFHVLDFPFLRLNTENSIITIGYTLAFLIIFALSIFTFAISFENITREKSQIKAQINLAHQLQNDILPQTPTIPGFDLRTHIRPADVVGGDFYDIHTFNDSSWIILGDVTGHGLESGMIMVMIQSIISTLLKSIPNISPKELNIKTNKILFDNLSRLKEQRPATLVSIKISPDNTLEICGSHDSLFIFRHATQSVLKVPLNHFPIGIGFESNLTPSEVEKTKTKFNKNDILLISTDGIIEATENGDPNTSAFGEDRIAHILKNHSSKTANTIQTEILNKLNKFTNGIYHDDLTLLVAKKL